MIGINPGSLGGRLSKAQSFVNRYGLTFTNLLDGTDGVYRHYGRPYHPYYWLLDKDGERVVDSPGRSWVSRIERALDNLDQGG